ncbi:hypothetical protein IWX48DRAFT_450639 [Phyllosticta citricarpa]
MVVVVLAWHQQATKSRPKPICGFFLFSFLRFCFGGRSDWWTDWYWEMGVGGCCGLGPGPGLGLSLSGLTEVNEQEVGNYLHST